MRFPARSFFSCFPVPISRRVSRLVARCRFLPEIYFNHAINHREVAWFGVLRSRFPMPHGGEPAGGGEAVEPRVSDPPGGGERVATGASSKRSSDRGDFRVPIEGSADHLVGVAVVHVRRFKARRDAREGGAPINDALLRSNRPRYVSRITGVTCRKVRSSRHQSSERPR